MRYARMIKKKPIRFLIQIFIIASVTKLRIFDNVSAVVENYNDLQFHLIRENR